MPLPLLAALAAAPLQTALAGILGTVGGLLAGKLLFKNYDDWKIRVDNIADGISDMAATYDALTEDKRTQLQAWSGKLSSVAKRALDSELVPAASIVSSNAASPMDLYTKLDAYFAGHERLLPLQREVEALNAEQAPVTGIDHGRARLQERCDIFCSVGSLLKWGVAIAAIYYGGKIVLDVVGHGDTIPRSQLPRYAGGTRRSR